MMTDASFIGGDVELYVRPECTTNIWLPSPYTCKQTLTTYETLLDSGSFPTTLTAKQFKSLCKSYEPVPAKERHPLVHQCMQQNDADIGLQLPNFDQAMSKARLMTIQKLESWLHPTFSRWYGNVEIEHIIAVNASFSKEGNWLGIFLLFISFCLMIYLF